VTNKEKQERANLARWLRENGVAINVDDSWQDCVLRMRQVGRPSDSSVFDLGNGAAGFVINLNIQIIRSNLQILDIYLDPPWSDVSILLLTDPVERVAGYTDYRFCGRKIFEFERALVLNHRLIRPDLFPRGACFQGLLLFTGIEAIPDSFVHDGNLLATVTFVDQFNSSYRFQVNLWIDRRHKWRPEERARSSRPSLFSQRDSSPVYSTSNVHKVEVGVVGGGITQWRHVHMETWTLKPRIQPEKSKG
jgi:hypothetical protein